MTVEKIGFGKLAMLVSRDEIASPEGGDLDMEKAHLLAEAAFSQYGISPDGKLHMEMEAFTGAGSVLIFAYLLPDEYFACEFHTFEELLTAAEALGLRNRRGVQLVYIDNKYYLIDENPFPGDISEFCGENSLEPREKAYLDEHGKILSRDLFTEIQGLF